MERIEFVDELALILVTAGLPVDDDREESVLLANVDFVDGDQNASKGWRKLRSHRHNQELIKGIHFVDRVIEQPADELKSSTTKSPATPVEIVA